MYTAVMFVFSNTSRDLHLPELASAVRASGSPGMSKRKAEALQDEQIVCKDCSSAFTFTVREQTAFAAKGFPAKVRCTDCTRAKKVRRGARARTHARHTRTANARDAQRHAHSLRVC